jgi:hypothetical protein
MAAKKGGSISNMRLFRAKPKRKRPGVHAKTRASKHKASKNYKKRYAGQGKR